MLARDEAVASHLFVLYAARSAIRAHQAKRLLFNGTSIIVIGIVRRIISLAASAPFIATRRKRCITRPSRRLANRNFILKAKRNEHLHIHNKTEATLFRSLFVFRFVFSFRRMLFLGFDFLFRLIFRAGESREMKNAGPQLALRK